MKSIGKPLLIACVLIVAGFGFSHATYPPDPSGNGPDWDAWSGACGVSSVADIACAFNAAHQWEMGQLGVTLPNIIMPPQAQWDQLSDSEKALHLINQERVARGVAPLHGVEENVISVAQQYAEFLLQEDIFDHYCPVNGAYCEGMSPWQRLGANPIIGGCRNSLSIAENLAVLVTSGSSIALPVERSVYMWMYEDAGSSWGHRHAILWYPYNDNSGPSGMEGFLGIGRANGGPYQGPFSRVWNFAELIVMNVFDPCEDWIYESFPPVAVTGPVNRMIDNIDGTVAADFSGTINPNGVATEGYFEYWLLSGSPPYTILKTPTKSIGSGQSSVNVVASILDLVANSQYAFRIVAENAFEVVQGGNIEFNTHLTYADDLDNDDHCKGFSPCWEPHIQDAVETCVTGATVKILYGDYLENSALCTHTNVYVHRDVILHLGLDDTYLAPAGAPAVIRPGSPQEATLTIESGTVIPWHAVIQ